MKKTLMLIGLAGFAAPAAAAVNHGDAAQPLVTAEVHRVQGGVQSRLVAQDAPKKEEKKKTGKKTIKKDREKKEER